MNKMPVVFIGHGTPMNALEDNGFTRNWEKIAGLIPRPEAILSVSAHWGTEGSRVSDAPLSKMVYDMYGFPEELYKVQYPAKGAPAFAHSVQDLISAEVLTDNSWGLDHGSWSVLRKMYPKADIPAFQLSVDLGADAADHYRIGQEISVLREKGVLILGSGNVVHNLAKVQWGLPGGYPWAVEFDKYIGSKIASRQFQDVIHYKSAGKSADSSFTTPEHFYPLLYVLGASNDSDTVTVFNDSCVMGSLSMTSYLFM